MDCFIPTYPLLNKKFVPMLVNRKKQSGLINVCSITSLTPQHRNCVYAACKRAVFQFHEALAYEIKDEKIDTQALCPSFIATNILGAYSKGAIEALNPDYVADGSLKDLQLGGWANPTIGHWSHEFHGLLFVTLNYIWEDLY